MDLLTKESSENLADTISESWLWDFSSDSTTLATLHNLHLSLTGQGITYSVCSGDWGANYQKYDYPQSEPEITDVGGTVATINASGGRSTEVGWSDGGGGWSTYNPSFNVLPSWQTGNGVPTNLNYRLQPDVSMIASGSNSNGGYNGAVYIYHEGGVWWFWGTSVASPLFASSIAVVEQNLVASGSLAANSAGKQRLGRLNDFIYSLDGQSNAFYDVTSGSNGTLANGSASNAGVGWDFNTGWGAPDFVNLENALAGVKLTISPTTVAGGSSSTGTVSISKPAPTGGLQINLTSQSPSYVTVPGSLTIPAGATTATFSISTKAFSSTYTDLIKAVASAGSFATATLTVSGDAIQSLVLNPTSVIGGSGSTGTVTLTSAAPTGGWVVNLTTQSSYYVSVPSSITVTAGATSANFSISTRLYTSTYTNVIQAADANTHQRATLTVIGDSVQSLSLNPSSVTGGTGSTGTVTLSAVAPTGGWVVMITSQSPSYVGVPSSITIPAGSTSGTFNVTTKNYTVTYTNVIQAADPVSHQRATLTVLDDSIKSLSISPSALTGGANATGTVTLNGPAPTGGWVVNLTSQRPTYVGVPASVTIPAGSTSATFNVTTVAYTSTYTCYVLAADAASHQEVTITVNP